MTAYISLFVALVGVVIFAVSTNVKVIEIGRLLFGCGLLVFLFQIAPRVLHLP